MVVKRKTSSSQRKLSSKSAIKRSLHKVTASYTPALPTLAAAKALAANVKQNPKAQVDPIQKRGSKYVVPFRFSFVTPQISVRNKVVTALKKSKYAHVKVSTLKA